MSGLTEVTILRRHDWAPHMMTLELKTDAIEFQAGQFFNLGLRRGEEVIRRSYSAASAPGAPLEFFLSEVNAGGLTPHVFALKEGDPILLDPSPLGFFTLKEVPEAKTLWLVATGTGLGPFVSMLRQKSDLKRFERIIVVHGVRHEEQLAYRSELEELSAVVPPVTYLPCVSGETTDASLLAGRITRHFESGALEERAEAPFDQGSHMLLCGNPAMVEDLTGLLKARGFEKHRRRKPGHFNFEKYW